jgi:hypothetical protein
MRSVPTTISAIAVPVFAPEGGVSWSWLPASSDDLELLRSALTGFDWRDVGGDETLTVREERLRRRPWAAHAPRRRRHPRAQGAARRRQS